MTTQTRSRLIVENPIGSGLDGFRSAFALICGGTDLRSFDEAFDQLEREGRTKAFIVCLELANSTLDVQDLASSLLTSLQVLPAARLLPSLHGGPIRGDLLRLTSAVASNDFDLERMKPLLRAPFASEPIDENIWNQIDAAAAERTPPPWPTVSSLEQTPWLHKASSFANSSEYRQDIDRVLKSELGPLFIGLRDFRSKFLGGINGLEAASDAVFKRCTEGADALFIAGWKGWPQDAKQEDVLSWFADLSETLAEMSRQYNPPSTPFRKPLTQPNKPIGGSTADRKLDIAFLKD